MKKVIPTEVYSRVVGYYRPVNQWNKGKQSEFEDRKECCTAGLLETTKVIESIAV